MEEVLQTIVRTTISYILLLVITYLFGKRMITHLNHHSFAVSITIGSVIANIGFDTNLKFLPMLASFLTLALIFYITSQISFNECGTSNIRSGRYE